MLPKFEDKLDKMKLALTAIQHDLAETNKKLANHDANKEAAHERLDKGVQVLAERAIELKRLGHMQGDAINNFIHDHAFQQAYLGLQQIGHDLTDFERVGGLIFDEFQRLRVRLEDLENQAKAVITRLETLEKEKKKLESKDAAKLASFKTFVLQIEHFKSEPAWRNVRVFKKPVTTNHQTEIQTKATAALRQAPEITLADRLADLDRQHLDLRQAPRNLQHAQALRALVRQAVVAAQPLRQGGTIQRQVDTGPATQALNNLRTFVNTFIQAYNNPHVHQMLNDPELSPAARKDKERIDHFIAQLRGLVTEAEKEVGDL